MSFLSDLKNEYKLTNEALMDAKKKGDKKLIYRFCEDLIRIADAMEREQ